MIDFTSVTTAAAIKLGLVGFIGSMIKLLHKPTSKWQHWLIETATGFFTAAFLTPMAIYWLKMPESLSYGMAFIIGMSGQNAALVILSSVDNLLTRKGSRNGKTRDSK